MNQIALLSSRPWVGGSSIAPVLCLPNPGNRTPVTECLRLWGRAPELDAEDEEFFEGRKALEPFINHKLLRKAGVVATTFNERYTHPLYSYVRAEIDAENETQNNEFKSASEVVELYKKQFGEEGSDDFPVHMAAQVQLGLLVRPKPIAFVNVCIGFDRFKRFPVEPDPGMQQMMVERINEFMTKYVLAGVMPDPINLEDARQIWPKAVTRSILATPAMVEALERMGEIDRQAKALKEESEMHRLTVEMILGDAEEALLGTGKPAVTFKNVERAGYTVQPTSYRNFSNKMKRK